MAHCAQSHFLVARTAAAFSRKHHYTTASTRKAKRVLAGHPAATYRQGASEILLKAFVDPQPARKQQKRA